MRMGESMDAGRGKYDKGNVNPRKQTSPTGLMPCRHAHYNVAIRGSSLNRRILHKNATILQTLFRKRIFTISLHSCTIFFYFRFLVLYTFATTKQSAGQEARTANENTYNNKIK